jgi:peptidoglycan hydrolase-like protein with peptidoglycan-binding domain
VKGKPKELLEDGDAPEPLNAGPVAVLSSVLIALMGSAILYNLVWRQNGEAPARAAPDRSYVEIVAGEESMKPATRVTVRKNLQRDRLVVAIQKELAALGYFEGSADGIAGEQTRQAVKAYQSKNGLAQTGRLDQKLLDHIRFNNELLTASEYTNAISVSPADDRVRKVQKGLAALGYRPGGFDGALGSQTREAIRQFERDRGWPVTGEITSLLIAELSDIGAFTEADTP